MIELLKKEMIVAILAMMPISELRGAIPYGVSIGLSPLQSTIISIIFNALIVPILLLIIKPVFKYFKKIKQFTNLIERIESRAAGKVKHYRGYRLIGLYLLVAIPVPTTGAYTGCVAASIMNIRFKNALIAIVTGVMTSGVIVYNLTVHTINLKNIFF